MRLRKKTSLETHGGDIFLIIDTQRFFLKKFMDREDVQRMSANIRLEIGYAVENDIPIFVVSYSHPPEIPKADEAIIGEIEWALPESAIRLRKNEDDLFASLPIKDLKEVFGGVRRVVIGGLSARGCVLKTAVSFEEEIDGAVVIIPEELVCDLLTGGRPIREYFEFKGVSHMLVTQPPQPPLVTHALNIVKSFERVALSTLDTLSYILNTPLF